MSDSRPAILDLGASPTMHGDLAHRQLQLYARDLKTAFQDAKRRSTELEAAYFETVRRLVEASQARDSETGAHLARMQRYVAMLGSHLAWSAQKIHRTSLAASLHDIGKIAIPDQILRKHGALDPSEWALMKRHTVIGARLLSGSPSPILQIAESIARTHHERWDGSGYPLGLAGEQIPVEGRVVMLADQYDALRSHRSYKDPKTHAETVLVITRGDDRTRPEHFDPDLLALFTLLGDEFDAIYELSIDEPTDDDY